MLSSKLNTQIGALRVGDILIALLLAAVGFALYATFSSVGYSENGRFAAFSVVPIGGTIYMNWTHIRSRWFLATVLIIVILHGAVAVFCTFPTKGVPGAIFWPFEVIDFVVLMLLVRAVRPYP